MPQPEANLPRVTGIRLSVPAGGISNTGCYIILAAAFLGWMFSGFQMAVTTLASRAATTDFLRRGRVTATAPFDLGRILWHRNSHDARRLLRPMKLPHRRDCRQMVLLV